MWFHPPDEADLNFQFESAIICGMPMEESTLES